ncbi:MAG: hypothetical protein FJ202_09825 [Gemmatimonadetes bacterium]|nr:hypothetical protein [Gemmatimonadota bacterium]
MRTVFTRYSPVLAIVVAACSGDSTGPAKPAAVTLGSSTAITGTVGSVLAAAPTFTVTDAGGKAIGDVAVTVAVTAGGGSLSGAPTKSSNGATSIGIWTLGTTSGVNTVTVTVTGLSAPLVINATGNPDVPSQVTVAAGNAQSVLAGGNPATPISFKVGDRFNNGVPNIPVSFSVAAGGGTIPSAGAVNTDANGVAAAPIWTIGKSTAPQQLRATAGAFTGTATATVQSAFFADVRFYGPTIDPALQTVFFDAASRIQGMITGDIPPVTLTALDVNVCPAAIQPSGIPAISDQVDDVIIFAAVGPIDGAGGVLGSAGPCFVRTTGGLTIIGFMGFDVADLTNLQASGRIADVILHEMLHVVGVGPLWASKGQVSGATTPNSGFIGLQAVQACLFHGGTGTNQCGGTPAIVPLETTGGSGTRDVHWRENTTATGIGLNQELMTGFVEPAGVANPLSRITIASLADIGYTVNLLPADSYSYPSTLANSLALIRESQGLGKFELRELPTAPIGTIDAIGRVTRTVRR